MNAEKAELMNIGYVPNSTDLEHPADRRRLAAWAISRGIKLNVENPLESDILVLSHAANFGQWLGRATQPVILDLVDGYIGEQPSFLKDFARNFLRSMRGTSSLRWITYTRHVKVACQKSDAVIVASPEQRDTILKYNSNVFVILDSHAELSLQSFQRNRQISDELSSGDKKYLLWEGFGYTLKHFRLISRELDEFLSRENWGMYLVTVRAFSKWGGFLGNIDSQTLVKKWFPKSWEKITIVPWTIENLKKFSALSEYGLIPINRNDKFALLKSENKLLSMWQLGLPVLFSNIPSYLRVANASNQLSFCLDNKEWADALQALIYPNEQQLSGNNERDLYLKRFHTHEQLMQKWSDAILSLSRNFSFEIRSQIDESEKYLNRESTP
jgi:hypothetical protein